MAIVIRSFEDFSKFAEKCYRSNNIAELENLAKMLKKEASKRKSADLKDLASRALGYCRALALKAIGDKEGASEMLKKARKGEKTKTARKAPKKAAKKVSKKVAAKKTTRAAAKKKNIADLKRKVKDFIKSQDKSTQALLEQDLRSGGLFGKSPTPLKNPRRRRKNPDERGGVYRAAALSKKAYRGAKSAYQQARAGWRENPAAKDKVKVTKVVELDWLKHSRPKDFGEVYEFKTSKGYQERIILQQEGHVYRVDLQSATKISPADRKKAVSKAIVSLMMRF